MGLSHNVFEYFAAVIMYNVYYSCCVLRVYDRSHASHMTGKREDYRLCVHSGLQPKVRATAGSCERRNIHRYTHTVDGPNLHCKVYTELQTDMIVSPAGPVVCHKQLQFECIVVLTSRVHKNGG